MARRVTDAPATPRAFCRRCLYPLQVAHCTLCPECGTPFDPSDSRTFLLKARFPLRFDGLLSILCLVFVVLWLPATARPGSRVTWDLLVHLIPAILFIGLGLGATIMALRKGGIVNRIISLAGGIPILFITIGLVVSILRGEY